MVYDTDELVERVPGYPGFCRDPTARVNLSVGFLL